MELEKFKSEVWPKDMQKKKKKGESLIMEYE